MVAIATPPKPMIYRVWLNAQGGLIARYAVASSVRDARAKAELLAKAVSGTVARDYPIKPFCNATYEDARDMGIANLILECDVMPLFLPPVQKLVGQMQELQKSVQGLAILRKRAEFIEMLQAYRESYRGSYGLN